MLNQSLIDILDSIMIAVAEVRRESPADQCEGVLPLQGEICDVVSLAYDGLLNVAVGMAEWTDTVFPRVRANSHTLLFVRRGALHIVVDGEEFDVCPDQTLYIQPDARVYGTKPSDSGVRFYCVNFNIRTPASKKQPADIHRFGQVGRPDRLTGLFHLLLDDVATASVDGVALRFMLMHLLAEAAYSYPQSSKTASDAYLLMEKGKAYIRRNSNKHLTIAEVAAELGVSPSYFGKAFRKMAGYTATEFIAMTRFHRARIDLVETNFSVKQIAHRCGFNDDGYFNKVFHKRNGMTPGAYRALHGRTYGF